MIRGNRNGKMWHLPNNTEQKTSPRGQVFFEVLYESLDANLELFRNRNVTVAISILKIIHEISSYTN